jgi:hypothetical protein
MSSATRALDDSFRRLLTVPVYYMLVVGGICQHSLMAFMQGLIAALQNLSRKFWMPAYYGTM